MTIRYNRTGADRKPLIADIADITGAEYKEERKILLRNLTGNGAFKAGARREAPHDAVSE